MSWKTIAYLAVAVIGCFLPPTWTLFVFIWLFWPEPQLECSHRDDDDVDLGLDDGVKYWPREEPPREAMTPAPTAPAAPTPRSPAPSVTPPAVARPAAAIPSRAKKEREPIVIYVDRRPRAPKA